VTDSSWTWTDATFNTDAGNNDEYKATIVPQQAGDYDYTFRYSTTGGRDWTYTTFQGGGSLGRLTVAPNTDTTPPDAPADLHVTASGPASIALAWSASAAADVYGYEVLRAAAAGGPWTVLDLVPGTSYTDASVAQGSTYWYEVRAVDTSWNRSAPSASVSQKADFRTVTLTFDVTVPASTDSTGRSVHIAGTLSSLDGGFPDWDPTNGAMTRLDATHWQITFTGKEGTQLQYKYALGDWNYVEKDASCGEIANRTLTLTYTGGGTQTENDVVPNWRNVAPCGN
jgi:hypothetical protein